MNGLPARVRRARLDDADAIARVHVETWRHAYRGIVPDAYLDGLSVDERRAMWRASIEKGAPVVLVAEEATRLAGFAAVGPCRDKNAAPNTFEIWALYVAPDAWGRSLGRDLCAAACALARSAQATSLSLWVIADNEPARRFYASVGFTEEPASRQAFRLAEHTLHELRYSRSV